MQRQQCCCCCLQYVATVPARFSTEYITLLIIQFIPLLMDCCEISNSVKSMPRNFLPTCFVFLVEEIQSMRRQELECFDDRESGSQKKQATTESSG